MKPAVRIEHGSIVVGLRGAWLMCGMIGNIAWSFDHTNRLRLVHVRCERENRSRGKITTRSLVESRA